MTKIDLPEELPNRDRLLQREKSDIDLYIDDESFPPKLSEQQFLKALVMSGCQGLLITPEWAATMCESSSRELFCNFVILANGCFQNTSSIRAWLLHRFLGTDKGHESIFGFAACMDSCLPFVETSTVCTDEECTSDHDKDGPKPARRKRLHYSVQIFDVDHLTPQQVKHILNASALFYLFDDFSKVEENMWHIQAILARCQNDHPALVVFDNLHGDDNFMQDEIESTEETTQMLKKRLLHRVGHDVPVLVISMMPLVKFLRRSLEIDLRTKWEECVYAHFYPEAQMEKLDAIVLNHDPLEPVLRFLETYAQLRTQHNIGPYFIQYTEEETAFLLTPEHRGVHSVGTIIHIESNIEPNS